MFVGLREHPECDPQLGVLQTAHRVEADLPCAGRVGSGRTLHPARPALETGFGLFLWRGCKEGVSDILKLKMLELFEIIVKYF